MRYVALLRAINVGGHSKLAMMDLRALLCSLGCSDVTTYLQSGNALFTSPRDDPEELAREIEEHLALDLGLGVTVLIRTGDEVAAVVAANPFPSATASPTLLHISFLSAQPDAERLSEIDARQFAPEEFRVGDRVIYLWYPNGAQRTKLSNVFFERRLGLTATARNWNTVTKLAVLANS
ncbi:MAG: DUF1697 domain-containing protein [Chloroflexota bacterium]|nr:DUF1697 domain-containing protein [Chloroflexota bacterium]